MDEGRKDDEKAKGHGGLFWEEALFFPVADCALEAQLSASKLEKMTRIQCGEQEYTKRRGKH